MSYWDAIYLGTVRHEPGKTGAEYTRWLLGFKLMDAVLQYGNTGLPAASVDGTYPTVALPAVPTGFYLDDFDLTSPFAARPVPSYPDRRLTVAYQPLLVYATSSILATWAAGFVGAP